MNLKFRVRLLALATVLLLCLQLPFLFPMAAQASASDELYGFSENAPQLGISSQEDEEDDVKEEKTEPDSFEAGQESSFPLGISGLVRSGETIPGYNVFEVGSYSELAQILSSTSYPSEAYPENSVYILLNKDVDIERGFTLHQSIEKIVIDGGGQYTLSEINLQRTYVSSRTAEVKLKDLTIVGNQFYGLFSNTLGTDVRYIYEQVAYTGPQMLWAPNSTAHFYDCSIHITRTGQIANEVAEIRDVFIYGKNEFVHNSTISVFNLQNNGNLILCEGADLEINVTGNNSYLLFTGLGQSKLLLEDKASLQVQGRSSQLAGGNGLHSIRLENHAKFYWTANRVGGDYIFTNANGGAKDAIYLAQDAEFHVVPSGSVSGRLIWISSGDVVVSEGAKLVLQADSYTVNTAPFALDGGGGLYIGGSATMLIDVGNSGNITYGVVAFRGIASSFTIDKGATVVIRGNRASAAVYFIGNNSSMEITDPNYLEIATTSGGPIHFNNAPAANQNTLTYTDVQQINYWGADSKPYLSGGTPIRRWLSETGGGISVSVQTTGGANGGLRAALTDGTLDPEWTATLDSSNFQWTGVSTLSAGSLNMHFHADGSTVEGRITAPSFSGPYTQGTVQLKRRHQNGYEAVSPQKPATPAFQVSPDQLVDEADLLYLWGEYGCLFGSAPLTQTDAVLSISAPDQIQFGTIPISSADLQVSAVELYALHVQDTSGTGWQVLASFSGFSNADKPLDGTLVVNDVMLQANPQNIAASAGNETVPLDAALLVPGGTANAGAYSGNITWTLVNAP